ncbi:MAG TPA: TAXI family TRAP transporter solute-binding subunit [Candidatus Ozemobacteraceae bacterium]|nr:TAXI family TRAP transporter solute-binding subunit [Candidatus Ozemobacteraceae bacterium]
MKYHNYYIIIYICLLTIATRSPAVSGEPATVTASAAGQIETRLVKRFLSIGTASINGVYYPLGTAMARLFNAHLDGIVAIPEPTAGSVANIEYLRRHEIALALVQSDVALHAFHGRERFEGRPFPELRVLASLYSEVLHIAVRQDSGITALTDLRGKNVVLGEEGSGTAENARMIMAGLGLHAGEFTPSYLGFTKATAALEGGYVDAVFYSGGVPVDGVALLARRIPIRLLPFPEPVRRRLIARHPFWQTETIPAHTYPGQAVDVETIGLRALLVTTSELQRPLATRILELLFDRTPYLTSLSPAAAAISLEQALKGIQSDMLHEAARDFYRRRLIQAP